ncbi:hypothetical protein SFRURICE_009150 [Spodoptera frugiperda]|nr:hypothetical protein SFRURICE_009150 [Spodoptera frugiperda]
MLLNYGCSCTAVRFANKYCRLMSKVLLCILYPTLYRVNDFSRLGRGEGDRSPDNSLGSSQLQVGISPTGLLWWDFLRRAPNVTRRCHHAKNTENNVI